MSTGRLTFLYPYLLRASASAARTSAPVKAWSGGVEGSAFGGKGGGRRRRMNSSFAKRAGKAVEPQDWEQQQQQQQKAPTQTLEGAEEQQQQALGKTTEQEIIEDAAKTEIGRHYFQNLDKEKKQLGKGAPAAVNSEEAKPAAFTEVRESKPAGAQAETAVLDEKQTVSEGQSRTDAPAQSCSVRDNPPAGAVAQAPQPVKSAAKPGEVEAVYLRGTPESATKPESTPPPTSAASSASTSTSTSTSPPQRYVHHFDSYSLVKQLQEGGYTSDQAISSMKAIRGLLARNLDVAQETLVSKSDVENEGYLFSAACSELSAEIKNNRRIADEHTRQQRTHLQHEVDILTQRLNQELVVLNDSVRGLFNDRRMAVREEQKGVDSAIQQVNYKMSIMLSSDSKSEIEGVRWILIRRSVVGILFMAMLTLGTIRYASYVSHERQKEAERRKKAEEEVRRDGGKTDHSAGPDAAEILSAN